MKDKRLSGDQRRNWKPFKGIMNGLVDPRRARPAAHPALDVREKTAVAHPFALTPKLVITADKEDPAWVEAFESEQ